MKWIQQSVALFKAQPRQSLYIAIFALGILLLSSLVPFVGVWFASIGLIYLQAYLFLKMTGSKIEFYELKKIPGAKSLLWLSLVMIPTNMMMGTLIGLIEGSDAPLSAISLIIVFSMVCSYIYILIFHAVGFIVLKGLTFRWAFDAAIKGMKKNKKPLLVLGLFLIVILALATLPMGAGLVLGFPIAFYSYYYSFRELYLDAVSTSETPSP